MKKGFNKQKVLFSIVAVCLVGLIGMGVSYAYYIANFSVSNPENANNNLTTTLTTDVVMDLQGKYAPSNVVPGFKGVKEVVVRGLGEKNSAPSEVSIQITPNFADFGNDIAWKLYKSDTPITCTSKVKEGIEYYDEATCDIPKSANLLLEGGAESDFFNITVNPLTETKYYLVVEYANNGNQSSQMGKSFSITIGLGSKGTKPVPIVNKITELAQSDTVNLASDDPDNNIRYIGANPNNYVYFNCSDYTNQSDSTCEKWRIIGVFNNMIKADGSKENLIKIIRDESLGNLSWDYKQYGVGSSTSNYGSNDWTDSELMMMLNPVDYLKSGYTNSNDIISYNNQEIYSKMGSYYDGTKGCKPASIASDSTFTCTEIDFTSNGLKNDNTRNAIETVIWNLGGTESYDSSNNGLTRHWYAYERGTKVYSGKPTIWTGKIGLMYPSDYGYATSGGSTSNREACLATALYNWDGSSVSDCKNNNYLYKPSYFQWTLAPAASNVYHVFFVRSDGRIGDYHASEAFWVRPAAFLKSDISIVAGTGTSSEPYQLSVN